MPTHAEVIEQMAARIEELQQALAGAIEAWHMDVATGHAHVTPGSMMDGWVAQQERHEPDYYLTHPVPDMS